MCACARACAHADAYTQRHTKHGCGNGRVCSLDGELTRIRNIQQTRAHTHTHTHTHTPCPPLMSTECSLNFEGGVRPLILIPVCVMCTHMHIRASALCVRACTGACVRVGVYFRIFSFPFLELKHVRRQTRARTNICIYKIQDRTFTNPHAHHTRITKQTNSYTNTHTRTHRSVLSCSVRFLDLCARSIDCNFIALCCSSSCGCMCEYVRHSQDGPQQARTRTPASMLKSTL